ncbi:MAG: metallophosphoesterase [Pseudomonadota bacterium]
MNALLRNRAVFLGIATTIFGLVMVFPTYRLLSWTGTPPLWALSIGITIFLTVVGLRVLHERQNTLFTRTLTAAGMTWLGISFVALVFTLFALVLEMLGIDRSAAASLALLCTAVASVYGIYNAQQIHTYVLDLNAPGPVRGLTFAQISDLHIGSRLPGLLPRVVAKTNALKPDYVLITGDLIDMRDISELELRPLKDLQAPAVFCTGNHERYVDLEEICQRLSNLGVRVLRNTYYVPSDHPELVFLGIDDAESKQQVPQQLPAIAASAPDGYRVLLYHRPDGLEAANKHNINLMLTGHTHRGQIIPFNFLVKRVFPKYYRAYTEGPCTLYVSPGTGTWGPILRLGSKCEITLIRLL